MGGLASADAPTDGEHRMGTRIVSVCYDGDVVLAADSRTSTGMYVVNRASDKISQLTDNVYVCLSGSCSYTSEVPNEIFCAERFEVAYPIIKELALVGTPGSKAVKQASQQLLPLAVKAMQENNAELAKEATDVFIWLKPNIDFQYEVNAKGSSPAEILGTTYQTNLKPARKALAIPIENVDDSVIALTHLAKPAGLGVSQSKAIDGVILMWVGDGENLGVVLNIGGCIADVQLDETRIEANDVERNIAATQLAERDDGAACGACRANTVWHAFSHGNGCPGEMRSSKVVRGPTRIVSPAVVAHGPAVGTNCHIFVVTHAMGGLSQVIGANVRRRAPGAGLGTTGA
ncbi:Proteasome subunit beta type-6 [Hordeum vulgare]|nr:Proteasome subunit beta type-6 [Hordeum vulgare]